MIASIALGLAPSCAGTAPDGDGWIRLFNGRDLTGWNVKVSGFELGDNHKQTFRVENGLLRVTYEDYSTFDGEFGHLFHENPFSHYRLRIEYRFVGEQTPGAPGWAFRNSGAMIHSQAPETMGLDQDFPVSIEAQMLGGDGENERPTANVCTPGTHVVIDGQLIRRHCTNSASRTLHGDQWVAMELEVRGNDLIRHFVNGELVLEYRNPQLDDQDPDSRRLLATRKPMIGGGYIALQAESHPVEFRRVELLPLTPVPGPAPDTE